MADFGTDRKIHLQERLKQLKDEEENNKQELEKLLEEKKKELEELEKKAEEEEKEAKKKEEETEEEILKAEDEEALEERIRDVKKIIAEQEQEISNLYDANVNENVQGVNLDLDYLMNASYISENRKLETQRDLYQQMKVIAQDMRKGDLSESYEFNKARKKIEEMHKRDGEDNFGYLKRIRNMLGNLDDYISGNR